MIFRLVSFAALLGSAAHAFAPPQTKSTTTTADSSTTSLSAVKPSINTPNTFGILEPPVAYYPTRGTTPLREFQVDKAPTSIATEDVVEKPDPQDVATPAESTATVTITETTPEATTEAPAEAVAEGDDDKVVESITNSFSGALTNSELVEMIVNKLEAKGFDQKKTLVATSLCCDEVNRPLETELSGAFDTNFNMGGLAGFPFGGATSFGAMASHIPDGGDCVVIYGPHVGVDSTGKVGTVERRGRVNGGACCGSAVAASGYVAGVMSGETPEKSIVEAMDALDVQQYFVGSMLMPYGERLNNAQEKMVELPYALYDAQTDLMQRIVKESAGAVGENGKIAVLGGIQLNTPAGYSDCFLPISFDLCNNKGEIMEQLEL